MQDADLATQDIISHAVPTEAAGATPTPDAGRDQIGFWTMVGVVALFAIIGHISSIGTGLYLDDYAHYQHLRDGDWSYRSAVDAARLGIVGEVLDLWGRQEAGLRFFRPVAFFAMRVEYTLGQWHPLPMHVMSIIWHLTCSLLVAAVATRCLGRRFWGMIAGCLMAIHPAHVGTVYWIACQTELMTTCLLLVGVLAYAKYAGWMTPWFGVGTERRSDAGTRSSTLSAQTEGGHGGNREEEIAKPRAAGIGYAFVALICYGLALGCRENAALFPVVCWMGDRLIGTTRRRWIRWEHIGFGIVLAAYMLLRWRALGGFPIPPPPYLMPVSASLHFLQYVGYKAAMYALGLFFFVPVVPVGSESFFAERWQTFYALFAAVLLLIVVIWRGYSWRRSLLWPAVWIVCLIAPMMLVFASPHHLYLPSLGMVLLVTAGLAAIAGAQPGRSQPRLARTRAITSGVVSLALAGVLGLLTWCMGFTYVRGTLSEDLLVRDVLRQHRPLRDGDHLFFINMPMLAYYATPAISQELGYRHLHGHVLVFSPDLMCMERPSRVQILDNHRLSVRAPDDRRYLSGTSGTMLLGVMGIDRHLRKGQIFDAGEFKVTITDMDDGGVRELQFTFSRPIDSPDYHFYVGSPQFMAYELPSTQPSR